MFIEHRSHCYTEKNPEQNQYSQEATSDKKYQQRGATGFHTM